MAGIVMYSADWCGDCRRSKALLARLGVAYELVDTETTPDAADRIRAITGGRQNIPVIVFPDGTHQVEPSDAELEGKLRALGIV